MPPPDSVPCSTLARLLGFDDRPQTALTLAQTLEQSGAAGKVSAAGSSPGVLGALTLVDLLKPGSRFPRRITSGEPDLDLAGCRLDVTEHLSTLPLEDLSAMSNLLSQLRLSSGQGGLSGDAR